MAGKKKAQGGDVPVVVDQKTLGGKITISPVSIVDCGVEVDQIEGLPEEFKRAQTISGFPPSPEWKNPGDALFGYFVTMRDKIGPNESRLYELAVPRKDEEPLTVAVWGGAALDRLIDSCFPPLKSGDKMAIMFLGEKQTKRGLNPVKLFALKIVRPDGKSSETRAA